MSELNSLDDIFNDDDLNILDGDSKSLFELKNVSKKSTRSKTDFVSRRKRCKDFDSYAPQFKKVHQELSSGNRNFVKFNEKQLNEGNYFVDNGILLLLEKVFEPKKDRFGKLDSRTRIIYENGTMSNMMLRSLGKNLFNNGQGVTDFVHKTINNSDKESGNIYVLKSKSTDERISSIGNLYKIGYTQGSVEKRIKDAKNEITYLKSDVEIISIYQCYNMNTKKLEELLHNFFGNVCLNIDIYDDSGVRHSPREWFIVPFKIIDQAVDLLINATIGNYEYDRIKRNIILKQ